VPLLHWFETIDGKDVMVTDTYGPTLDEVFRQSGRYFSLQSLLILADQLMSRVEFIHSRNIIHGNLSPLSFAFGRPEWQKQQVILVDFGTEIVPAPTIRDDLQAISRILSYFYSGADSWEKYQQQQDQETTAPVLTRFSAAVASRETIDYGMLRDIFYDAYHDIVLHLEITMNLIGPRAMRYSKLPKIGSLAGTTTGDLFESLSSALSRIGQLSGNFTLALPFRACPVLLDILEEALQIYMTLIARDRPSAEKKMHAMSAYHLPNRLWRDLHWFLKVTANLPRSFQLSVVATLYYYLAVLYEAVPSYRLYWAEYLLFLARARKDLEPACGKSAWTQTVFFWHGIRNRLKAQSSAP
jgi:serine/threonine protein kinase